jgi:hypothetical protein
LFLIYGVQELCEGLFASGHPAGLIGILGHGGWIAAPIALVLGAALAGTLRVADALIRIAGSRSTARRSHTERRKPPRDAHCDWRLDPGSGVAAGRAPPTAFSLS